MPSTPPETIEEILKTGELDAEFVAAYKNSTVFSTDEIEIEQLKKIFNDTLGDRQEHLAKTKPSSVIETTHYIPVRDGWASRTIRVCPSSTGPGLNTAAPCIVLLYGGGHCIGEPELELELARQLSIAHSAVVFLPSYRLAPDFPFPYSINDSWDVVQAIAKATGRSSDLDPLIPSTCSLSRGFIVGGTSAGANLSAAIAHLARDYKLQPPLTGQFLCCGTFISQDHVPDAYKPYYLSWEQNSNSPIMSSKLYVKMSAAFKPDLTSPLWASFDQHDPRDKADVSVKYGHIGLPPAYFQICGADQFRDDSLIYERLLREECGVATRLDMYRGWPHCWWAALPAIEKSRVREMDTVAGIGWLLETGGRT